MTQTEKPTLPTLKIDYKKGQFENTMTGEITDHVAGVLLGFRHDRVLWPALSAVDRRPECVNGSVNGPCEECQFGHWLDNLPPLCNEELTVLIFDDESGQALELTGRRTYAKVLDRYLGMKAQVSGVLHDQRVTIRFKPEGQIHRPVIELGELLVGVDVSKFEAMAERMKRMGHFGGL